MVVNAVTLIIAEVPVHPPAFEFMTFCSMCNGCRIAACLSRHTAYFGWQTVQAHEAVKERLPLLSPCWYACAMAGVLPKVYAGCQAHETRLQLNIWTLCAAARLHTF